MLTTANILALLTHYKYLILFPVAVAEGPIITMITGFFIITGFFNIFYVYAIVVAGDIVGDSFYYFLGRGGGALFQKIFKKKINSEKVDTARTYFANNSRKALVLSKVMHGIGISGLIAAGSMHVPYRKFITICTATSIIQSAILLVIGIIFGHAYLQFGKYLNYFAAFWIVVVLGAIVFLIIKYRMRTR